MKKIFKIIILTIIAFIVLFITLFATSKSFKTYLGKQLMLIGCMSKSNKGFLISYNNCTCKINYLLDKYSLDELQDRYNNNDMREETWVEIRKQCNINEERVYHPNGQLAEIQPIVNGRVEGLVKGYYETGELEFEAIFKNGKVDGLNKRYYKDGKIKNEVEYKEGKQHGKYKQYYNNGNIELIHNYKDGISYGDFYFYYEDGTLRTYRIYENDSNIFYSIKFDKQGRMISAEHRMMYIKDTPETMYVGEEYTFKIGVTGPVYEGGNIEIYVLWFLSGHFKLLDLKILAHPGKEYLIGEHTNQATYTFKPEKAGKYRFYYTAMVTHPNKFLKDTTQKSTYQVIDRKDLIVKEKEGV